MKRLLIGAALAFAGALLIGFGVRAGLESYYLVTRDDGAPIRRVGPDQDVVFPCGSLLAPAEGPAPQECAALRDQRRLPAALLSVLGFGVIVAGAVVLVTGRPRPPAPSNPNPWELGSASP